MRLWRRKEGKQPKEGKAFHAGEKVAWKKSGGMDMDVEDEIESRKKLDEQKKRSCRRSCEKLKRSRVCRKRFRKASKMICRQQSQEVEQRRHDLVPEHQTVQKRSQKFEAFRIKEELCKKKKRC